MSELSKAGKVDDRPMIATITGTHGAGKTSLAASFPNPIFIRVEDGMIGIPKAQRPDAFEELNGDVDKLFAQLGELCNSDHNYKTCVIDTVSALENDFINHIMALTINRDVKSINQASGGYGAGPSAVAALHDRVRKTAEYLNRVRGMHVLFLAHTETVTVDLPDSEPFMQYSICMGKKSVSVYTNFADMVAQCKLESYLKPEKDDKKTRKAEVTGNRIVSCVSELASVNKNRYGIVYDLPFIQGKNPFEFLDIFSNATQREEF